MYNKEIIENLQRIDSYLVEKYKKKCPADVFTVYNGLYFTFNLYQGIRPSKEAQDMDLSLILLGLKDKAAGKKLVRGELYDDPVWTAWMALGETLSNGGWNSSSARC